MNITLILAAHKNDVLKNDPFMPLALPIIASIAPEHKYKFIDMLSEQKVNFNEKTDIVGISYRITAEKTAFYIADEFRKRGVKVVLGGAQASVNPFDAKLHADAVVIGEAEPLWRKILDDAIKNDLSDFYVVSPSKFDGKGARVYQIFNYFDLKSYKTFPIRHFYKRKYAFDTVYASRGCPIDCDFCSVPSLFGKKIRMRDVDDVVKEIDTFKNYYYLLDDTVFGRKGYYDYYLELYEKIASLRKKRLWVAQGNLDAASDPKGREVIKKAAKAGLVYVAIGIESINYDVLKKSGVINKLGVDADSYIKGLENNIRFIQEQGIIISGWFTIGYEEDTIQTFYDTLDFCIRTKIIPVISLVEAIPGTKLYDRLKKEGKISYEKRINIVHSNFTDEMALNAINNVNKVGFSIKENFKRLNYYFKFFDKDNENIHQKIANKIHKTIFLYVLQSKIKKGVVTFANEGIFSEKNI